MGTKTKRLTSIMFDNENLNYTFNSSKKSIVFKGLCKTKLFKQILMLFIYIFIDC
jgi:hypothetical protein